MKGGAGEDEFGYVDPGNDKLFGGPQADYMYDYSYNRAADRYDRNVLEGGSGNDYLYGHNKLNGGSGGDDINGSYAPSYTATQATRTITGGSGQDEITSESNVDDTIYAQDGERDTVGCGGGTDTVYYDEGLDSVNPVTCENLNPRR